MGFTISFFRHALFLGVYQQCRSNNTTHVAKPGEITGKTRVIDLKSGEITGKNRVLPGG